MIKYDMVRERTGIGYNECKRFIPFLNTYYKEMQLWGIYLSDISFEELNDKAKTNFIDSSEKLWISANSSN